MLGGGRSGSSLIYCAGGGATILFLLGAVTGGFFGSSGGSSVVGDMPPDIDRCAVAEYPELKVFIEFTVSLRLIRGNSEAPPAEVPLLEQMAHVTRQETTLA